MASKSGGDPGIIDPRAVWEVVLRSVGTMKKGTELLAGLYRWEIRFNFRYVELSDSITLVVYMTFRTAAENLKIGEMASHLSCQRIIELGYFGDHFSVIRSRAAKAFFSSAA